MTYKIYHAIKRLFNAEKTVSAFYQQDFSGKDFEDIAEAAALAYVEDKISFNKLKAYCELLSYMELDNIFFSISCLYKAHLNNDIVFSLKSKKCITESVLHSIIDVLETKTDISSDDKDRIRDKYTNNIAKYITGIEEYKKRY